MRGRHPRGRQHYNGQTGLVAITRGVAEVHLGSQAFRAVAPAPLLGLSERANRPSAVVYPRFGSTLQVGDRPLERQILPDRQSDCGVHESHNRAQSHEDLVGDGDTAIVNARSLPRKGTRRWPEPGQTKDVNSARIKAPAKPTGCSVRMAAN